MERRATLRDRLSRSASSAAIKMRASATAAQSTVAAAAAAAKTKGALLVRKMDPGKATVRRMLEGFLSEWVEGGLGAEWEDEDGEKAASSDSKAHLRVSLRKGEMVIGDVRLKKRSLEALGLPFLAIEEGYVGEVRILVPYTHLGTRPLRIEISGLRVTLKDTSERVEETLRVVQDEDEEEIDEEGYWRERHIELGDALRQHWMELCHQGSDKQEDEDDSSSASKGSFARRVAGRALELFEVEIKDCEISYHHDTKRCGVRVGLISARNDVTSLKGEVRDLAVYAREHEETCLVEPISLKAELVKGEATCEVSCKMLSAKLRRNDLETALSVAEHLAVTQRRFALGPGLLEEMSKARPVKRGKSARLWWYCAFRAALLDARRLRPPLFSRWYSALDLALKREEYVLLRCRFLATAALKNRFPKLDVAAKRRLMGMERDPRTPVRAIVEFRAAAATALEEAVGCIEEVEVEEDVSAAVGELKARESARKLATTLSKAFQQATTRTLSRQDSFPKRKKKKHLALSVVVSGLSLSYEDWARLEASRMSGHAEVDFFEGQARKALITVGDMKLFGGSTTMMESSSEGPLVSLELGSAAEEVLRRRLIIVGLNWKNLELGELRSLCGEVGALYKRFDGLDGLASLRRLHEKRLRLRRRLHKQEQKPASELVVQVGPQAIQIGPHICFLAKSCDATHGTTSSAAWSSSLTLKDFSATFNGETFLDSATLAITRDKKMSRVEGSIALKLGAPVIAELQSLIGSKEKGSVLSTLRLFEAVEVASPRIDLEWEKVNLQFESLRLDGQHRQITVRSVQGSLDKHETASWSDAMLTWDDDVVLLKGGSLSLAMRDGVEVFLSEPKVELTGALECSDWYLKARGVPLASSSFLEVRYAHPELAVSCSTALQLKNPADRSCLAALKKCVTSLVPADSKEEQLEISVNLHEATLRSEVDQQRCILAKVKQLTLTNKEGWLLEVGGGSLSGGLFGSSPACVVGRASCLATWVDDVLSLDFGGRVDLEARPGEFVALCRALSGCDAPDEEDDDRGEYSALKVRARCGEVHVLFTADTRRFLDATSVKAAGLEDVDIKPVEKEQVKPLRLRVEGPLIVVDRSAQLLDVDTAAKRLRFFVEEHDQGDLLLLVDFQLESLRVREAWFARKATRWDLKLPGVSHLRVDAGLAEIARLVTAAALGASHDVYSNNIKEQGPAALFDCRLEDLCLVLPGADDVVMGRFSRLSLVRAPPAEEGGEARTALRCGKFEALRFTSSNESMTEKNFESLKDDAAAVQLVEPATFEVEEEAAGGLQVSLAALQGECLGVCLAPQDATLVADVLARTTLKALPGSKQQQAETRSFVLRGALRLTLVDRADVAAMPCIGLRLEELRYDSQTAAAGASSAALTAKLLSLEAFSDNDDGESWRALISKKEPLALCAQLRSEAAASGVVKKTLRVGLGALDVTLDAVLARSASRLSAAMAICPPPARQFAQLRLRNETGAALEIDQQNLGEKGEVLMDALRASATTRDGRALATLSIKAQGEIIGSLRLSRRCVSRALRGGRTKEQTDVARCGDFLLAEYSYPHDGEVTLTLRSAARVHNKCDCGLVVGIVVGEEAVEECGMVAAGSRMDLDLSTTIKSRQSSITVRREGAATWTRCILVSELLLKEQGRPLFDDACFEDGEGDESKITYKRTGGSASLGSFLSVRELPNGGGAMARLLLCPRRVLSNELVAKLSLATRSSSTKGAILELEPRSRLDLLESIGEYWCLKVNGFSDHSSWVDVSPVLFDYMSSNDAHLPQPALANDRSCVFAVRQGDRRLTLTLRRRQRRSSSLTQLATTELELVCGAVVYDRSQLHLGFLSMRGTTQEQQEQPRAVRDTYPSRPDNREVCTMLDLSPHSGLTLECTVGGHILRSPPFVPASVLASANLRQFPHRRPEEHEPSNEHALVSLMLPPGSSAAREFQVCELGLYYERREATFGLCLVPRVGISHRAEVLKDYLVLARQRESSDISCRAGYGEGCCAPFYWSRAAGPRALELALVREGARTDDLDWSEAISLRTLDLGGGVMVLPPPRDQSSTLLVTARIVNMGPNATHELLVETTPLKKQEEEHHQEEPSLPAIVVDDDDGDRVEARLEVDSLVVRWPEAQLELTAARGFAGWLWRKPRQLRCKAELRATVIRDLASLTNSQCSLALVTRAEDERAAFCRAACVLDRQTKELGAGIDFGDAAVALDEAAVWRACSAAQNWREAWDSSSHKHDRKVPAPLYSVDRVALTAFALRPLSLKPDARARRSLLETLSTGDTSPALNFLVKLASAFPRLAISDAEIFFDPENLRPPGMVSLYEIAGSIADAYLAQIKQRWWSLASSISLASTIGGGAPVARQPPVVVYKVEEQFEEAGEEGTQKMMLTIVVEEVGALGLVIGWRDDGTPIVSNRKPCSLTAAVALADVDVNDEVVAIHGRAASSFTSTELVDAMRRRPLTLRISTRRTRVIQLTVPSTDRSLGFSVGVHPTRRVLVVTEIKPKSTLARHNVQPGAKLLKIAHHDVQRFSLESLTRLARDLANTDRILHLRVDDTGP